MKIYYNCKKGRRFKGGTYKSKNNRYYIFSDVECKDNNGETLWWSEKYNKWIKYEDWKNNGNIITSKSNIHNVKSFIRHIKKCSKYLPKGTKFTLISRFRSINDIEGVI